MGLLFSLAQPTGHNLHSREPLMSAAHHQVTKCSLSGPPTPQELQKRARPGSAGIPIDFLVEGAHELVSSTPRPSFKRLCSKIRSMSRG